MFGNLAIITGFGGLSEEVLRLADGLTIPYVRYKIRPWLPLIYSPAQVFDGFFDRSRTVITLDPFDFGNIERELKQRQIKQVFFTGDFPRDRFAQVRIRQTIWGQLDGLADEKCRDYFLATPTDLSDPVRYLLALSNLLSDLEVKILLAHEIFPELNVSPGDASIRRLPAEILTQLPAVISQVARQLARDLKGRLRFAQAVVVDNGILMEVEAVGTNDLLQRYKSRSVKQMPFLLKIPSVEFNPALDQPTLGPDTIKACRAAGVSGIVICAEMTTIVERQATVGLINQAGMFLYAVPFSQLKQIYVQNFPETWAKNVSITVPPR